MYKVKDGNTVHKVFATAKEAIQYYKNNDDIVDSIDPQPTEEEFIAYDADYVAKATAEPWQAKTVTQLAETVSQTNTPSSTLLSAAEARETIRINNERLYDTRLAKLISDIIEGNGVLEVPLDELNDYMIYKLKTLGYNINYASPTSATLSVETFLVPTSIESQTSNLIEQLKQTKVYRSKQ